MTHYKLYSLHLGCGEPLATQYQHAHVSGTTKKPVSKKSIQPKTNRLAGRKRK